MTIEFQRCDRQSIEDFRWPSAAIRYRGFLTTLVREPITDYFRNCETEFLLGRLGEHLLPITVNNNEYSNSYVCSPYCGVVRYPLVELREIRSRLLKAGLAGLICAIAPLLRLALIDRVVCVNNWLLSTNLYPRWKGEGLKDLLGALIELYPTHAILFRSLNRATNSALCDRFCREGFDLAPSRQVYIFDNRDGSFLWKQNTIWDMRLLTEKTPYQAVKPDEFTSADDSRIKRLYDMLYLEKYTELNPQFSENLIRLWRETGVLRFFGLRNPTGSLDGIVGCFERDETLTAPLVGYDTTLPKKFGLYRMLMAVVLREAANQKMTLNLSSGAAHFKRLRGAVPYLEYTGIYCQHLPRSRQAIWKTLAALLTHVGARVLQRYQL